MLTAAQPADYDHCCFKDPNLALTFTNTDDMGYLYFSSTTHRKIRSVQRVLILQKVFFQFHQSGCRLWGSLLPCSSRLHIVAHCLGSAHAVLAGTTVQLMTRWTPMGMVPIVQAVLLDPCPALDPHQQVGTLRLHPDRICSVASASCAAVTPHASRQTLCSESGLCGCRWLR